MRLLEKICKELGVEVGEEWLATNGFTYLITKSGELHIVEDGECSYRVDFTNLLLGKIKPVWKPKDGEMYYVPRFTHDENHRYWADMWKNGRWDNWAYNNKLIFKTKQEAINCANEMIILARHGI